MNLRVRRSGGGGLGGLELKTKIWQKASGQDFFDLG